MKIDIIIELERLVYWSIYCNSKFLLISDCWHKLGNIQRNVETICVINFIPVFGVE